jgi:hypothetical protein
MVKVGMMTSWGTAGTEDSNWADFEHMFRNCTYDGLRFENVWDINQRSNVCGFFHPQVWGLEPCIDENGNSLFFSAYWYDKKDKERNGDSLREDKRIMYYAQRANTPNEAFINTTVNIFASEALNHHLLDIKVNPSLQFYRDGVYEIVKDEVVLLNREEVVKRGRIWHEYITDVPHRLGTDVVGCVREYYPPQRVDGILQPNMYFIAVDPTGVDKNDQKEITEDHSLYCFQIYTYFHPKCTLPPRTLVAEYTGRLPRREDNDKIVLLASMRYNAKVLVEANRGELISNFKKWKQRSRLMKDPTKYFTRRESMTDKEEYGITITGDKKMDGLKMLKDSLYEIVGYREDNIPIYRLSYILSESLMKEFQVFTINGNFDRISTALIAEYEFSKEELKKREEFTNTGVRIELDKAVGKGARRQTLGRILARV